MEKENLDENLFKPAAEATPNSRPRSAKGNRNRNSRKSNFKQKQEKLPEIVSVFPLVPAAQELLTRLVCIVIPVEQYSKYAEVVEAATSYATEEDKNLQYTNTYLVQPYVCKLTNKVAFVVGVSNRAFKQYLILAAHAEGFEAFEMTNVPFLGQPGVLVSDMDKTAVDLECLDAFAASLGKGQAVKAITEQAMNGELDFAESLRARVELLKGAKRSDLVKLTHNLPVNPGFVELCKVLQARGWKIGLASGGFVEFVRAAQKQIGHVDHIACNLLDFDGPLSYEADGFVSLVDAEKQVLNGKVKGQIVDDTAKAEFLKKLATSYKIHAGQTIALGDGANDIKMAKEAAWSVGYLPKDVLREQVDGVIVWNDFSNLIAVLEAKQSLYENILRKPEVALRNLCDVNDDERSGLILSSSIRFDK